MDDWTQAMRAAAADPPPSSVDLDGLIRRETIAARRRRYALAGVTTAVLVGAMGTTGLLSLPTGGAGPGAGGGALPLGSCGFPTPTPQGTPPTDTGEVTPSAGSTGDATPSATPVGTSTTAFPDGTPLPASPEPMENAMEALIRLSTAMDDALATYLPGIEFTDPIHPNCERPQLNRWTSDQYDARLTFDNSELDVDISRGPSQPPSGADIAQRCNMLGNPAMHCERRTLADGSVAWLMWADCDGGQGNFSVEAYRTDGTLVSVTTGGRFYTVVVSATPSVTTTWQCNSNGLTVEQLLSVATTPGLTLYP